jgi:hypothetical protein
VEKADKREKMEEGVGWGEKVEEIRAVWNT